MHKSWDFQVAEGPVKQLIMSFIRGAASIKPEFSNHVSVFDSGLPTIFLEKSSLMITPPAAEAFVNDKDNNKWKLYLTIVPSDHKWKEEIFKNFEHPELIKNTMGQMIKSAMFVFQILKKTHSVMKTLSLKTDENSLTLYIEDSSLDYNHSERLFTCFCSI